MPNEGRRVYRPTRRLRQPPANLTPAQRAAYTRLRLIESFAKDFVAALPGDMDVSVIEVAHYCTFAKQVWRHKDTIQDKQELERKVELRIGHWSEVMRLKEPVLRRLATEILRTELTIA